MLFYSKITESEGIDISEGKDVICSGVESFKRHNICHFYFFKNRTLTISLMFVMNVMLPYVLNQ